MSYGNFSGIAIPIILAAVALYPLTVSSSGGNESSALTRLTALFFELSLMEQVSVLTLWFSIVFGAIVVVVSSMDSISINSNNNNDNDNNNDKNNNNNNDKNTASTIRKITTSDIQYPEMEISNGTKTTELEQFLCLYPMLRKDIVTELCQEHELQSEALDWITDMMDYNVPGGKLNRGTTVLSVQSTLAAKSSGPLSARDICRAAVLGWTIEFLQAFFLVADDVMDDSQTRRGQPCWYKQPHVKMIAINDSFLLESFVFTILRKHFGQESYYLSLVELFLTVIQKTEVGQLLDLTSQPMDQPADLSRFTLERYRQIVKYKTAYYTFYLPIAMGMITSGVTSAEAFLTAERICCAMGEYFQIQDDYLDCYGKPEVIGKVGTDIQDNKCSWLVVQALNRATPEQRQILVDNYGCWDDVKVQRVKDLYADLKLEEVFRKYEEDSYAEIQRELDALTIVPRDVFDILLRKIYKRSK
jgi:farnesyl diphosphate synthase